MLKILRTFAWTLPFIGFLIGYGVPPYFLAPVTQKAPNLIGRSLQEAITLLSEQHLNAQLMKELEDAIVPAGTVLHQIPSPALPIKKNQTVSLTVSKKPIPFFAPDLISKKQTDFTSLTKKCAATVENVLVASTYPSHNCIAQSPAAGAPLTTKIIFAYIPSRKKSRHIVPNLTGIELEWVDDYLTSIPITYQVFSGGMPITDLSIYKDLKIISQRPLAGSIIDLEKPPCIQIEV